MAMEDRAFEIFKTALHTADPYDSVKRHADRILSNYKKWGCESLYVIGFGKAACHMAKAVEDCMSGMISAGTAITKYGHCGPELKKVRVFEAGHPVPDENGLKGADEAVRLLRSAGENTLVVCLISGGGSALLVSPYEGITLDEKQGVTRLLLNAGADINELNTVRKHISKVKGGRLAEIAHPARIISLILSDVIGDRLDVIASGPTSPDSSSYQEAIRVMDKYSLREKAPQNVINILERGAAGLIPETPKSGSAVFGRVENIIIGSNKKALEASKNKAAELGLHAEIISSEVSGEAKEAGKWLAAKAMELKKSGKQERPACLISGGETTVTVTGSGLGGRNTELALSFAMAIEGVDGVTLLSAGTDGTDGPTDAAGAVVSGQTAAKAKAAGIDPEEYLTNNDSYSFFKKTGGLLITGPTGTNVMDLQVMLIE